MGKSKLVSPAKDSRPVKAVTKRPVHVKWHNKTIALGTFNLKEAEDKCSRAKALTRMWRLTMKPKPTYEWVVRELEKTGVREIKAPRGHELRLDPEMGVGAHTHLPRAQVPVVVDHHHESSPSGMARNNSNASSPGARAGIETLAGLGRVQQQNNMMESSSARGIGGLTPNNTRPTMGIRQLLALQGAPSSDVAGTVVSPGAGGGVGGGGGGGGNPRSVAGRLAGDVLSASELTSLPRHQVNPYYELLRQHHMDLLQELQETTAAMRALEDQMLETAYNAAAPSTAVSLAQLKNLPGARF